MALRSSRALRPLQSPPPPSPETIRPPRPTRRKPPAPTQQVISALEIVRKGQFQRNNITYSDGATAESWILVENDLMLLEETSGTTKFICELPRGASVSRTSLYPPALDMDPVGLAWINSSIPDRERHSPGKTSTLHYQASMPLYNFIPTRYTFIRLGLMSKRWRRWPSMTATYFTNSPFPLRPPIPWSCLPAFKKTFSII